MRDTGRAAVMPGQGLRALASAAAAIALAVVPVPASAQERAAPERQALDRIAPLDAAGGISFFVARASQEDGARPSDSELCTWALADWVRESEGRIAVAPATEDDALISVYFVAPGAGLFGEMRPVRVGERRGAEVYVRADTDTLDPEIALAAREDPLYREAVVYLTCLHEIGHALGFEHTSNIADVMYYFGFGGDIVEFFGRYRSRLDTRADIEHVSGLSPGDLAQLRAAYPRAGDVPSGSSRR